MSVFNYPTLTANLMTSKCTNDTFINFFKRIGLIKDGEVMFNEGDDAEVFINKYMTAPDVNANITPLTPAEAHDCKEYALAVQKEYSDRANTPRDKVASDALIEAGIEYIFNIAFGVLRVEDDDLAATKLISRICEARQEIFDTVDKEINEDHKDYLTDDPTLIVSSIFAAVAFQLCTMFSEIKFDRSDLYNTASRFSTMFSGEYRYMENGAIELDDASLLTLDINMALIEKSIAFKYTHVADGLTSLHTWVSALNELDKLVTDHDIND